MNDISQIREEIVAEAEATQRAADEAKRQAEMMAEVIERQTRRKELASKILPFIKSPHVASINEKGCLIIDGVDVAGRFWLDEEFTRETWRPRRTGKFRLCVEEDSTKWCRVRQSNVASVNRRSFPQRKDGGHNYQDVAAILVAYAVRQNEIRVARSNQEFNAAFVRRLVEELGIDRYGAMSLRASTAIGDKPFVVDVKFSAAMSADQVRVVYDALVACGVVKKS